VVQVGSAGAYKKPAKPKAGDYFNDVSGKTGKDVKEVRTGLADLLLVTGSLSKLPKAVPWPAKLWRELNDSARSKANNATSTVVYVGKVTLKSGSDASFALDPKDGMHVKLTLLQKNLEQFFKAVHGGKWTATLHSTPELVQGWRCVGNRRH